MEGMYLHMKGGGLVAEITERFFQMENQWNVIHLPIKPRGFGILIFGDQNQYVENGTSFWIQHYGRRHLLDILRNEGYTLINSNLYGSHWGSPKAIKLTKQLYSHVRKKEILNRKFHIFAEGMGALVALQLMEEIPDCIRSVGLLDPCINLVAHLQEERESKFFYSRLREELAKAYQFDPKEIEKQSFVKIEDYQSTKPVRIWQRMTGSQYPYDKHSRKYEEWRRKLGSPIKMTYHLADDYFRIHQSVSRYFQQNEKEL
ncbi:hypothetical protein LC087_01515 [Bacillus carboniphilus]|uniref:Alpha/beta hydrolase n=1 Tax=Bacillus carboniphilus TaxID=86663 RepID=A0ABY9JU47_9BACI|nr:hypothetical protein [Bacillus carboniphilus]WLR42936.1 hypothetical protein LC087_01515 [Bacillus carboniphilus]